MKRSLYTFSILLFTLLLAAGCRTRRGGSSNGADLKGPASDHAGYVNVAGTELGNWTFEGGYNEQGQYVGAGGLFSREGEFIGDTGGYDEGGNWVGEKGYFNSKGEWFGPGGGYDKDGTFVGVGGMYDKSGKYVGIAPKNAGLLPKQLAQQIQANPNERFVPEVAVGLRPIYFGYDQDVIPFAERASIERLAQKLQSSGQQVLLEGHCDERGSKAYNLGLGDRRSQAVRTELIGRGIAANRITTTSYGSEKPVALGHNESAWRQNRRVNFQFY